MAALPREFFKRIDEQPDAHFYAVPQAGTHLDAGASQVLRGWYEELLPCAGEVLDLLAGAHSHLPTRSGTAVGLGLDASALAGNHALSERFIHDVNDNPELPLCDRRFAAAVCSVSIQYLTQPVAVFQHVARVLAPGGRFLVAFSNRMFPSKAVLCWRVSDDAAHARLIQSYFHASGAFGAPQVRSFIPKDPQAAPVYLMWADAHSERADSSISS